MPLDGPRTVKAKLGPSKVQTVKILRPTASKRIAATRQFEQPKYATLNNQSEKSKSPSKSARQTEIPTHHQQQQPMYNDEGAPTIKPAPVQYQPAQQQVYSHVDFAIDENQDIGDADHDENNNYAQQENIDNSNIQQQNGEAGGYFPLCQLPTGRKADVKELDPKSYQYAPACWTERIRPAGRTTYRSERLYNILTMNNDDY